MVSAAGADAIGLNFYSPSPRSLSMDMALQLVDAVPDSVARVGLFVNATDDEVCRAFDHLRLDFIQLHGDEPPEYLLALGGRPVIRAFRLGPGGLAPILEYLAACALPEVNLQAVLIDAYDPYRYGGTGETADWEHLARERTKLENLPFILAGGLNEKNVAEAIFQVRPDAVDTASGVEAAPGKKDRNRVQSFVQAAQHGFSSFP
jgi:phosphoribosylanthranilate isomerase